MIVYFCKYIDRDGLGLLYLFLKVPSLNRVGTVVSGGICVLLLFIAFFFCCRHKYSEILCKFEMFELFFKKQQSLLKNRNKVVNE